jgi:hypothetical protein
MTATFPCSRLLMMVRLSTLATKTRFEDTANYINPTSRAELLASTSSCRDCHGSCLGEERWDYAKLANRRFAARASPPVCARNRIC